MKTHHSKMGGCKNTPLSNGGVKNTLQTDVGCDKNTCVIFYHVIEKSHDIWGEC